jgi:DNA-binding transcriptional LysR family regulator
MHALMLRAFEEAGIQPRVVQQAAQLSTVLGLVESCLGVAMIPHSAAKYVGPDIRVVPLTGLSQNLLSGIAMATLPDLITTTARNFREHALRTASESG